MRDNTYTSTFGVVVAFLELAAAHVPSIAVAGTHAGR